MLTIAFNMRANYIETGDVNLSRNDAIAMRKTDIIKPLTADQLLLVIRLRQLARDRRQD